MILLSTGSLYTYGLARVFAMAADAGFDGVEVLVDGRWDSRDPSYLGQLSRQYGLPIAVLHSPFVPEIQGWPSGQLERLERTVALAEELGVGTVVSHLPLRISGLEVRMMGFRSRRFFLPIPWKRRGAYYRFLREGRIQQMGSTRGVRIALENMPARHLLGIPFNAFWFNRPMDLGHFPFLTMDTTHWGTFGQDPNEIYPRLRERIVHVHLSNFNGGEHRTPWDGHLDLGRFLRLLREEGYRGAVSVECEPESLNAWNTSLCQETLKRALAFCQEHLHGPWPHDGTANRT